MTIRYNGLVAALLMCYVLYWLCRSGTEKIIYLLAFYSEKRLESPTYPMYLGSQLRRSKVQFAGFSLCIITVLLNFMYVVNSCSLCGCCAQLLLPFLVLTKPVFSSWGGLCYSYIKRTWWPSGFTFRGY
jgi:hypothetical protein